MLLTEWGGARLGDHGADPSLLLTGGEDGTASLLKATELQDGLCSSHHFVLGKKEGGEVTKTQQNSLPVSAVCTSLPGTYSHATLLEGEPGRWGFLLLARCPPPTRVRIPLVVEEESISAQVISTVCPALPHAPPGPLNKEGEGLA